MVGFGTSIFVGFIGVKLKNFFKFGSGFFLIFLFSVQLKVDGFLSIASRGSAQMHEIRSNNTILFFIIFLLINVVFNTSARTYNSAGRRFFFLK
ncbi:MAG: hypothetical protein UW09_C0003G0224 [candidate division TM6 bacterium GW2011_GWF2_43_87]|nr:MAG: hypothetical protein UW09_C0003G0224 [candidate division TM6 bacterium GW2011_GWF2_43_87]